VGGWSGWRLDLVHHVLEDVERGGRVEDEAGLAAGGAHELQRPVDVLRRLRVEGDEGGARVRELADDLVDRRNHQVDVNRRLNAVLAQGAAHHRADGQVGHVVVVHHVEVDRVGASSKHILNLLRVAPRYAVEERARGV